MPVCLLAGCPILRGYRTSELSNACWLSDSSWLSDIGTIERLLLVRFFPDIGHRNYRTLAGCPILRIYRTSELSNACWLSDSSRLSDIGTIERLLGCPILRGYRTSRRPNARCLSDSFRLSDIGTIERLLLVRFFPVIGHRNYRTLAGCPILSGYRTSELSNACWLSDSSRLSDIGTIERLLVVRFFAVIGQTAAAPKANHNKEGHPQSGHPLLLFIK